MILAVDDEPHIRHVLRLVLQRAHYPVAVVDNGQEAIALLQENPHIQLIVTDLVMPGVDGFELIRHVRKRSQIPIVVLTASGEEQYEHQARQQGADAFLTKPFSREELLREVERLLSHKALTP